MQPQPQAAPPEDGVRHYSFLCLAALLVLGLALVVRGLGVWGLLPSLVGVLMLVLGWRNGALWVLLLTAWMLAVARWPGLHPVLVMDRVVRFLAWIFGEPPTPVAGPGPPRVQPGSRLLDILLALSVLVYVAGYYRFLSVTRKLLPGDPRRRLPRSALAQELRRPPALVTAREIGWLLGAASLCVGSAWVLWHWLAGEESPLELGDNWWQAILVLWLFGIILVATSGILTYLGRGRMGPDEAALILQDTLWRETRREQGRLNRWLTWARLRRWRKEAT